ncbi:MAG: condensation domain-containing protein, partial [Candidatus Sulfotelmatobacter sp.]
MQGPSVAQGYWRKAKETEETFNARIPETGEGPFLRTGDLGFLKEGYLFITGRLKDLLIIRGQNYYPQDIELTVEQSHPILQPGSGAAFSVEIEGEERLVVVQEVAVRKDPESVVQSDLDELDTLIKLISRNIVAAHELQAFAVVLIRKSTIPKTSSGKIQRHACRDAFLNRELYVLREWHERKQREPVLPKPSNAELDGHVPYGLASWLAQEIARIQGIDQERVDLNQPFAAYGLDSLAAIEFAHKLQTEFQVEVDVAEFFGDSTITEVIRRATKNTRFPVRKVEKEQAATYPLSYGQRALWFVNRMAPESAAYNIAKAFRIRSSVDVAALGDSFQTLVDQHPALRATIIEVGGEPVQQVADKATVSFEYCDATDWGETELIQELLTQNRKPFRLAEGPLFRVHLYRLAEKNYVMHVAVHHIVSDLWSLMLLFEQLGKLYQQRQLGADPKLAASDYTYADFVAWQRQQLAGPEGERLWSYWKNELSGELAPLDLPADHRRPQLQTFRGSSYSFVIDQKLCDQLRQLGAQKRTTLFATLFAAFQALLHRLSGQKDIVVGFPTTGRARGEFAQVAGYFVNPLPLRATFDRAQSFNELFSQVRNKVTGALSHDLYPFALMVEKLGIGRDSFATPIFQSIFALQTTYGNSEDFVRLAVEEPGARLRLGDLQLEPVQVPEESALFDVSLTFAEGPQGLTGTWQYNSDLFEQRTIARWVESFQVLLEGIVSCPETRLSRLGLLSENDRAKILEEFNPAELAYDRQQCVHQEIEQQTKLIPSKAAIAYRGRELSYHGLNAQANRVARYLVRMGVGKGDLVGVLM